jgi:hypothetical protein
MELRKKIEDYCINKSATLRVGRLENFSEGHLYQVR